MWIRAVKRKMLDAEGDIRTYRQFDRLVYTATDHIVYHADSRDPVTVRGAGGFKTKNGKCEGPQEHEIGQDGVKHRYYHIVSRYGDIECHAGRAR